MQTFSSSSYYSFFKILHVFGRSYHGFPIYHYISQLVLLILQNLVWAINKFVMVWVDAEKSGSLAPYPRHKPPLLFFIKFPSCRRVPQFCTFGFKLSTSQAAARQLESLIWQLGAEFLAISAKMAYYLISENAITAYLWGSYVFLPGWHDLCI